MMATAKMFKSTLPPSELKVKILKIPSTSSSLQVSKPDLDDNKKRWLVVGICLHSVISPALRQYVDPIINSLYASLKQGHSIDRQTFRNHLIKYPPTNTNLNYEAINNNKNIPWCRGKKDLAKYDYNVLNPVDLSKLFMVTHMAQYTGFDLSCDSSALLGLLINIDKFPVVVQTVAQKIRTEVRNPWAHCNFKEWNSIKYLESFQLMNQIVKNLNLPTADEIRIIGELSKWEANGIHFLQGTTIGLDLLEDLKEQICDIAKYSLEVTEESDKCFQNISIEMDKIQKVITHSIDRVNMIDSDQEHFKKALKDVKSHVETLYDRSAKSENQHEEFFAKLKYSDMRLHETVDKIDDLIESHDVLTNEVCSLQEEHSRTKQDIQGIRENVKQLTIDIESVKYTSHDIPKGKVFFYPPYRIKCFVGRVHDLKLLESSFVNHINDKYTYAICGLGGCGKTTLAIEYAWTYQNFYPSGIFWMSADSHEALETSVSNLAFDINTVGRTSKETFARTLKWVGSLPEKWLLVIDNADGDISGNIQELLLGIWQRNTYGHILITSRREPEEVEESFMVEKENCLYLDVLSKTEGTFFLKKRTNTDTEDDNDVISTLVEELGGLPLALEQAGAYMKIKKSSFTEYLKRFKKKRLQLLNAYIAKSGLASVCKERLAVKTTWQMNIEYIRKQSEQEGIGSAALTVMEITSFLFADDIPVEIINNGIPAVEDEDVKDALQDSFGIKQVTEILTRFSLFQRYGENTLAVHRLVQEVIRESLNEPTRKMLILQSATRMINKALRSVTSPYDVVCVGENVNFRRGALYLWSKLAANASALKTHVLEFSKNSAGGNAIYLNLETLKILQTSAIFNSIHQRQDEALADQKQMLHLMTNLNIDATNCHEYTSLKVPLLEQERTTIQNCLSSVLLSASNVSENVESDASQPNESELLRIAGNAAFKEKRYQDAIQYYTEGIRACSETNIDHKLLSNRSLLYLKIGDFANALTDAERCIVLAPNNWKGYCWRAYAIANLVKRGELPSSMETVGLASACIASNMNEECLVEYKMKIYYPVVVYQVIEPSDNLAEEIASIFQRPFTSIILRKGLYVLTDPVVTSKSMQLIGIEDGVEIDIRCINMTIMPPNSSDYGIPFEPEREIHLHFENIFFVTGSGQISVVANAIATFYKCKFSNGKKGCDDFPRCNGGPGCVNQGRCLTSADLTTVFGKCVTGLVGYPGVCICDGGKAYLINCVLDRCGGGGVLSDGENSYLEIRNCTVQNMRQMGVEARNGGKIVVENNVIIKNQFHGVCIAPRGTGVVRQNTIHQNGQEGIFCGGILVPNFKLKMNSEGASRAVITDNIISQNGLSGISLDGGTFEVSGNKIMDNWLWGMLIKSRSATYVLANDIFENKCGGIRIGTNYSATVIIDGNTIRDHTGPDVFILNSIDDSLTDYAKAELISVMDLGDEISMYSLPPVITNRNIRRNNNKGIQHPRDVVQLIQVCSSCFRSCKNLKHCAKCKTATYCSKECQTEHWKLHKNMCKILHKKYTIQIQMKNTLPFQQPGTRRIFDSSLKGIKEGPPPDPKSQKNFIVKVQSGDVYSHYNPSRLIFLYDRSVTLDIKFSCPELYHLINECGVLSANKLSTKKIFCYASFKENGEVLCIHTDSLPPFQSW